MYLSRCNRFSRWVRRWRNRPVRSSRPSLLVVAQTFLVAAEHLLAEVAVAVFQVAAAGCQGFLVVLAPARTAQLPGRALVRQPAVPLLRVAQPRSQ